MSRRKKIVVGTTVLLFVASLVFIFPIVPLGPSTPVQLHDTCSISSQNGQLVSCIPPSRGNPPPVWCPAPCDAFGEWYGSISFSLFDFGGYLVLRNGSTFFGFVW